jgi:hypothetical protein
LVQQIKGRGTRLCKEIDKKEFVIFDFCGVCEYFEEKYDWEAPLKITEESAKTIERPSPGETGVIEQPIGEDIGAIIDYGDKPIINRLDFVNGRDEIIYGPNGDKVDREMYQSDWQKAVIQFAESRPEIKQIAEDENRQDELLEIINTELLNKPELYFNEDTLIQSHQVVATLRDFFLSAIGKKDLPNREQQLKEWKDGIIEKYGEATSGGSQQKVMMTKLIVEELSQNEELKKEIRKSPNILFLNSAPFNTFTPEEWVNVFGKDTLLSMILEIKNSRIFSL